MCQNLACNDADSESRLAALLGLVMVWTGNGAKSTDTVFFFCFIMKETCQA